VGEPVSRDGIVAGESQLENVAVAGVGVLGTFIVTVHGIGPYDASHSATGKLMGALDEGLVATLEPVDFNWCGMVEAEQDDREKMTQLSTSILEAAHLSSDEQTGAVGYLVRGAGFLFEALFKLLLLSVPICALLLISAVPIYVRFGAFGLAGVGASFALHWIALLWTLTVGSLGLGLILSGLLRVIGFRLFGATLLRRMILVILQPVIPLAYRLGNAGTRQVVRNLALFAVFYGLLTGLIHWWSPDAAAQWFGLGMKNLSIGAAALGTVFLAGLGISKVISAPVKLARDIFNYIGDVHQRPRIQEGLSRIVEDIPRGAHVILVGHSLGSVIALDSLCNSSVWATFSSVSFVTCGSPIFRFFQRFFPGLYFPRDVTDCVSRIQLRSETVRWLNVFRTGLLRGDPVGQALFSRGGSGRDLPVRQKARILMRAHLDYWDDEEVIESVRGSWREMLPSLQMRKEQTSANPVRHALLIDKVHSIAQAALVVCVFAGFIFGVANAFAIIHQRRVEAKDFLARAVSTGVEIRAKVTHSTTNWGYGEDLAFPVQVYEFEFKDRNEVLRRLVFRENENSNFDGGLYFDSAALRKLLGRNESEKKKKTFGVQILYVDDDIDHLTLADPRVRPNQSGFPVFEVLWTGIGASFFPIILLLIGSFYACRRVAEALLPPSHRAKPLDIRPDR
jgi:hypothetical protein